MVAISERTDMAAAFVWLCCAPPLVGTLLFFFLAPPGFLPAR